MAARAMSNVKGADMNAAHADRQGLALPLLRWLLPLAIGVGLACRAAQYFADRSYWGDEASLVLNIRSKTALQLLGPLDYAQAAPPLFLLAERGVYRLLGGSELPLRALPFLLGMAALLLFAAAAARVLPSPWDALAVLMFALSDRYIAHASEVKPYSGDIFVSTMFLFLAIDKNPRRDPGARLLRLSAAAAVAVWFSFPSVILFGAMSVALLPGMFDRRPGGALRWVALNAPVAASFLGLLLLTHATQKNAVLSDYWKDAFIDWHRPFWIVPWFDKRLLGMCDYPTPSAGVGVLLGLCAGVGALCAARRWQLLAITAGPILLALVPAGLHRYPFDGARLTAYLTPCALLLAAIGFQAIYLKLGSRLSLVALAPALCVVGVDFYWCGQHVITPRNRGHLRPVARYVSRMVQPDETLYVFDAQAFRCYWPPHDARLRDVLDRADQIPTRSFWIIWSHGSKHGFEKPAPALDWARQFCHEAARYDGVGGSAVRFDRLDDRLPARLDPPFNGIDVTDGRKRASELTEGK